MFYVTKCKLHPTKKQAHYFDCNIGCCRWVYNHCLQYAIEHYERNKDLPKEQREKRPTGYDLQKRLPALKQEHPWLAEVDSQALKFAAASVDVAFKHFFRRIKRGDKPGFPRFRSKHRGASSFTLTQGARIRYTDDSVHLPKLGRVKLDRTNFNPPENTDARLKRCTIRRSPVGNYYVSILFEDDKPEPAITHVIRPDQLTVLDLGLKKLCRVQGGDLKRWDIHSPRFLRDNLDKLQREQRKLSRKTVKSARWQKQKKRVAKIHEKIRETRNYFFHLLANDLINANDGIVLEKLDIRGMVLSAEDEPCAVKRRNINKAFADQSLGAFINTLSYKSARAGKPCYLVDTLHGPNKVCSDCGQVNDQVTLMTTEWTCTGCGVIHDRSDNCLVNLQRFGVDMAQEAIEQDKMAAEKLQKSVDDARTLFLETLRDSGTAPPPVATSGFAD